MAEHPGRFFRVVTANTGLPTGDQPMPDAWVRLREVARTASALSVSRHPSPRRHRFHRRCGSRPISSMLFCRLSQPAAGQDWRGALAS